MSDDILQDLSFVQVLENIFDRREIRTETVVIKDDNTPTQYKSKCEFESYAALAKRYNVCIIQIYGPASHRKGLIDAMSSFGVKSVFKTDIVGLGVWFANSQEVCQYLDLHKDLRMSYNVIDQVVINKKLM